MISRERGKKSDGSGTDVILSPISTRKKSSNTDLNSVMNNMDPNSNKLGSQNDQQTFGSVSKANCMKFKTLSGKEPPILQINSLTPKYDVRVESSGLINRASLQPQNTNNLRMSKHLSHRPTMIG